MEARSCLTLFCCFEGKKSFEGIERVGEASGIGEGAHCEAANGRGAETLAVAC